MAEITAQSLYNQLSPMAKRYYDQQFKNQYTPNKENILLSSQPEYNKMKAVYEAEQQVPEKSFLDSINIFGSASAAEPDIGLKLAGDVASKVSNTPGFETVLNPNGTISIVPVDTSSSLPFNVGDKLFNQFNNAGAVPDLASFDPRSLQSIFPTNVQRGITASSAAIPFGTPVDIAQGFTLNTPSDQGTNFQFLPSANEANETDVVEEKKRGGIADLFRALLGFAIPGASFFFNKGRDALGGIRSLNQRLRNTDFAKSRTLADYFDARKYGGRDERDAAAARNMAQARGIQKKIDRGDYGTRDTSIDRGRGQTPSRTTSSSRRSSGFSSSARGRALHSG